MRTIEKILWYPEIPEYNIELLKKAGLYNGTGTKDLWFDDIIDLVFKKIKESRLFDVNKASQLRRDIQQLVIRHDLDTFLKIGFLKSNLRLSFWLYKLLHKLGWKYRLIVPSIVFYAVNFTKKARNNYYNKI